MIANGKANVSSDNVKVQDRAVYSLDKREINTGSIEPPVKGVSFFSL